MGMNHMEAINIKIPGDPAKHLHFNRMILTHEYKERIWETLPGALVKDKVGW